MLAMPPSKADAVLEVRALPPPCTSQMSLSEHLVHLRSLCHSYLKQAFHLIPGPLPALLALHPCIQQALLSLPPQIPRVPFFHARLLVFVYICAEHLAPLAPRSSVSSVSQEALAQFAHLVPLPSERFEGVWESLQFGDADLKPRVLRYVTAALQMAQRNVNRSVVGWNGVLLFYGPPGTGKTSLSGALVQKLCIRAGAIAEMGGVSRGMFVRVRMESLLSKYFSESGVRVGELFEGVRALARAGGVVGVLLDEVETLGMCRKGRVEGGEPADGVRVVNALLGGLDSLSEYGNVVVVCTSNLVEGIDEALVDRVDMKICVGLPAVQARIRILEEVVRELVEKGVVAGEERGRVESIATLCEGVSGRKLRKLGILGLAEVGGLGAYALPVECEVLMEGMTTAAKAMMHGECVNDGDGDGTRSSALQLPSVSENVAAANDKERIVGCEM